MLGARRAARLRSSESLGGGGGRRWEGRRRSVLGAQRACAPQSLWGEERTALGEGRWGGGCQRSVGEGVLIGR